MASVPCDGHGSIVRGRLCGAYPALVQDGRRTAKYKRFCVDCMHELLVRHKADWIDTVLTARPDDEPTRCTNCGIVAENGALSRFFCTTYLDGKARRDFWALYCPTCTRAVAEEFELAG